MMRTTITLPDDLAHEVKREAQRRRVSIATVARDALQEHLHSDTAPDFIGIGSSGQHDVARNAEQIIAREWGDAHDL
jgi:metal-responsive CopG/Arc/MetJ family transcriptional regulator